MVFGEVVGAHQKSSRESLAIPDSGVSGGRRQSSAPAHHNSQREDSLPWQRYRDGRGLLLTSGLMSPIRLTSVVSERALVSAGECPAAAAASWSVDEGAAMDGGAMAGPGERLCICMAAAVAWSGGEMLAAAGEPLWFVAWLFETCAIDCSGDNPTRWLPSPATRSDSRMPEWLAEPGATGDVEWSGPGQLWNVELFIAAPASHSAGDLPGDLFRTWFR